MRDVRDNLPALIAWANRCQCMWTYFGSGPVPVFWHITTTGPSVSVLDGIHSVAGPVVTGTRVSYVPGECPYDLPDKLSLHLCTPDPCPCRPLALAAIDARLIPIRHRHVYAGPRYRENVNPDQGNLFG